MGKGGRHGSQQGARAAWVLVPLVAIVTTLIGPGVHQAAAAVGRVKVSVGAAAVVEGDAGSRRVYFAVTLSRSRAAPTSVFYATQAVTAAPGTDYVQTSGKVTIPSGATSASVSVVVKGNTVVDAPTRSFRLTLTGPTGAQLGRSVATGAILDDDLGTGTRVSVGSATVVAGNEDTRGWFAVTLSRPAPNAVSVAVATRSGTANAEVDFTSVSRRVTIPAGARVVPIAIPVLHNGGTRGAPVESFTVRLSAPVGAEIGRRVGTGTIRRDGYGTAATWAQAGGDAGLRSYAAQETTLSVANIATVHQLWSVALPAGTERGLQPVSDGTAVYVVQPEATPFALGRLTALDLETGQVLWSVTAFVDDRQQNLAVSDGLVIATGPCPSGICLRAYHASDGTLAWQYRHGTLPFVAPPTIFDGVIYASDDFGSIELDLETGVVVGGVLNDWDYQSAVSNGRLFRSDYVYDLPSHQRRWYSAFRGVRVTDGVSVFRTENSRLRARAVATGAEQWGVQVGCDLPSPPAVSAEAVVIQGCGVVRGFNRHTGVALWAPYVTRAQSDRQPTIANDLVFINDESGFITVLYLATGALVKEIDDTNNSANGTVVVLNGKILVSGYNLRAYGT